MSTPRMYILLDCAESELDLYLRSWSVGTEARLLPSNAAPYFEAEPLKFDVTTKKVERDTGVADYPVRLNYDPAGLAENQTVGKTTTIDGGTFYAWIHPDMFDAEGGGNTPAAGDLLMVGPVNDAVPAARAYTGFRKLLTTTGFRYCVGQYLWTESKNGIDYLYCQLWLPGTPISYA